MTESQPNISFTNTTLDSIPKAHRFEHKAMATTFEIIISHDDATYAQQAAYAAFEQLDRLELELSRFIENSDISRINNLPANQPLRIGLDAFECLKLSIQIYAETNRAFDITTGSLTQCWLNKDKTTRTPFKQQLDFARQRTGCHLIQLNEAEHTVQLTISGVQIDLGGLGKGYAIDQMARLLKDWGINIVLIHGGFSSILAMAPPPNTDGWKLTLSNPHNRRQTVASINLNSRAVSASGLQKGLHIIDPRTARPVRDKSAAWACAPDAATADALSTAFMVISPNQVDEYCLNHPEIMAMILTKGRAGTKKEKIYKYGPWKHITC